MAPNVRARLRLQPIGFSHSRPLQPEHLEQRQLLSAVPLGAEISVAEVADVKSVKIGMDDAGNFVVAWQAPDASGQGIFARRFAEDGTPLGDAFAVNTFTTGDQAKPRLDMNGSGQFVIIWESVGQDGSGLGIFARVFDTFGNPLGNEFQVNTTTAGDQKNAQVDMNDAGTIVIGWSSVNMAKAQRFTATGVPLGSELTGTGGSAAAVGIDGTGGFILAGAVDPDVQMQRFAADGTKLGPVLIADMLADQQALPQIAMNDAGAFILSRQLTGLQFRRYSAQGIEQGQWTELGTTMIGGSEHGAAIDDAGNFWIAYGELDLTSGSSPNIGRSLRQFDADGQLKLVSRDSMGGTPGNGLNDVAMHVGRAVSVALRAIAGPTDRIVVQRFVEETLRVSGLSTPQGEYLVPDATAIGEVSGLEVHFASQASTAGGAAGASSVLNPSNWQLFRYSEDLSAYISGISYADGVATIALVQALPAGKYTLVAKDTIHDLSGAALDGDEDGVAGANALLTFKISNVRAVGEQIRFNETQTGLRAYVAANATGQSLVVWSTADPNTVNAQRYDASGAAVGSPLLIDGSASPGSNTLFAAIDADGGFMVLWRDTTGTVVQHYDAEGAPVGSLISIIPNHVGFFAAAADGRFAVTEGDDLYLYSADGNLSQHYPLTGLDGLAYDTNGILIGVRQFGQSVNEDDPMPGISVLRYAIDGTPLGQIIVTDYIPSSTMVPAVAANPAGGFSVTWQVSNAETFNGGDFDIFARSYDENGQPLGNSFQVNSDDYLKPEYVVGENVSLGISPPGIAFDGEGHLAIAWQAKSADYYDVGLNIRAFLPTGAALGGPQRLNLDPNRNQINPVAAGGGGNLLVTWTGPATYLQRFNILEPPILDLSDAQPGADYMAGQVQPNGIPVAIADPTGLTISSNNASELQYATLRVVDTLPGDLLAVDTTGTAIVASYANGVLQLTGIDSLANYQQVLRTATFATTASHPGSANIEIEFVVNDGTSESPTATARVPNYVPGSGEVAGRYLFYNNSSFASGINRRAGIATDKSAYLPNSGTASFANISSYVRGLNGIIIDLGGEHGTPTLADFSFRIGTNNSPDTWTVGPTPTTFAVRPGLGVSGTDGIEFVWPDSSLRNVWLEVTVAANIRTGLAEPDVFYFGSRVGDTGSGTAISAVTNLSDDLAVRNNLGSGALITNVYDIDRNRSVQLVDAQITRTNIGVLRYLNIQTVEATNAQATATALAGLTARNVDELVGPLASTEGLDEIAAALTAPRFGGAQESLRDAASMPAVSGLTEASQPFAPLAMHAVYSAWQRIEQGPAEHGLAEVAETVDPLAEQHEVSRPFAAPFRPVRARPVRD